MQFQEENKRLKKQLRSAQDWIRHEVNHSKQSIQHIDEMLGENISFHEDDCREKIQNFFPPLIYMFLSDEEISCLISSELIYAQILQGECLDGMNVILWYHKVLDAFIEKYITLWFREYVSQKKIPDIHDPLEGFLEQVCEKKYSISAGRLFQLCEKIKNEEKLLWYQLMFQQYIEYRKDIKKALLESDFLLQCRELVEKEYVWEKRHSGFLEKQETAYARNLYIGKLRDTNCLLWIIAASQQEVI